MTPLLANFYRGMELLTKNKEKKFSKDREVLTLDTDEVTEEEDDTQAEESSQKIAEGPVRVDVLPVEEGPQRRPAKRHKKENCKVVIFESLEGSVAMTEEVASTTHEDTRKEVNLWTLEAGPSGVQAEDPVKEDVEPLEEMTATTSQGLQPSERKQPSLEKEDVPLSGSECVSSWLT
ncbi:hypothetical protein AXG93_2258s1000 [Marchantia polymorpha subsp. ruderalis]|uniref:Uncharacterized protein n=1 Tax=Marchantia polymorpha subsp. ruderalis TaxID=1480154 RepID=A0A176VKU1_MARPO|nr:hypothetical protein AXG93_2258s1000 [Marchantia polymorpha subsp. ruderalis]